MAGRTALVCDLAEVRPLNLGGDADERAPQRVLGRREQHLLLFFDDFSVLYTRRAWASREPQRSLITTGISPSAAHGKNGSTFNSQSAADIATAGRSPGRRRQQGRPPALGGRYKL